MTEDFDIPFVLSRMNYRESDMITGPHGASNCASCMFSYRLFDDKVGKNTTCMLVNILLQEIYDVKQVASHKLVDVNPKGICDAHLHRGETSGYSIADINKAARMYAMLLPVPQYYRQHIRMGKPEHSQRLCPRHSKQMSQGGTDIVDFDGMKMVQQILYCPEGCNFFEKTGVPRDE